MIAASSWACDAERKATEMRGIPAIQLFNGLWHRQYGPLRVVCSGNASIRSRLGPIKIVICSIPPRD